MKPGSNVAFSTCEHTWELHGDVTTVSGPAAGNSVFRCDKCTNVISLVEKCAIEQVQLQMDSLKVQERHTRIGMQANIIAAVSLVVAVLVLVFGDALVSSSTTDMDIINDSSPVDFQIQNP